MAVLRHLEVLRMPCSNPWALASLAVQLPRLRSLDLRLCCGDADAAKQLSLSAATALTELRMTATTDDIVLVQQMVLPPRLQVLILPTSSCVHSATQNCTAMIQHAQLQDANLPPAIIVAAGCTSLSKERVPVLDCLYLCMQALHLDLTIRDGLDWMIAFLDALPLERLASLSIDGSGLDPDWDHDEPLRQLTGPPPLTQLTFDSVTSFDRLYRFLHPLATRAASQHVCSGPTGRLTSAGTQAAAASGESSGGWCLRLTCGGLEHELSAADILQWIERGASARPAAVVHGCLVSATFLPGAAFRTVGIVLRFGV